MRRICNKVYECVLIAKMLMYSGKLPQVEDAIAYLQRIYPDQGGSCLVSREQTDESRNLPLSIIVPAYNVEKYIGTCLESVLQQITSLDYEVIVINDGSTDGTAEVLKLFEENPKVQILHQENRGLSGARNAGINHAKGEYLCFLDGDDELAPGAIDTLMTTAVRENAKLVIGSFERCFHNGTVLYTQKLKHQKVENFQLPGFAHGRVIHFSVFRGLRFPEGYWFEDSIMAQVIHPICQNSIYTLSDVCYRYFLNESGITSQAIGNVKSLDSLWITMRLLKEREEFHLVHTQYSYEYFLSMVNLTFHRTKYLGVEVSRCIFIAQRMLLGRYYGKMQCALDYKKQCILEALQKNFKKYVWACEMKR